MFGNVKILYQINMTGASRVRLSIELDFFFRVSLGIVPSYFQWGKVGRGVGVIVSEGL